MRHLLLLFTLCCCGIYVLPLQAQDAPWAVANISQELLDGADVVVRNYRLDVEILPSYKLRVKTHEVKTIMNKGATQAGYLVIFYDQFRSIKKFTATTYDKNGKEVKKLKKSEVVDMSIAQNSVDDSRIKAADMTYNEYPFTVEFDYEVEYDGLFFYPTFAPQSQKKVSVEFATYTLTFPPELRPRIKELNIKAKEETPGRITWEVDSLKAFGSIPYSPPITDFVPVVLTAPGKFELDGFEGDMSTWAGFAAWYSKLNEGRDKLLPEDVNNIKQITADLKNKEEIIKAVYEYMQSKTRYVSVQLGIGGYRTMPASDVSEDGWGDCKALTNYTKALLQEVGIKAYPALVYAGRGAPNIIKDFSSNQFNHVILCVPLEEDTVWLECTSREVPYNFLGAFTDDRDVLFVDDVNHTGTIVHTPSYDASQNYLLRKATVTLDAEGNGKAHFTTTYGGLLFDQYIPYLDESEDKLTELWYEHVKIPGYSIEHIAFDYDKEKGAETKLNMDISLKKYASRSGKRFFFNPNIMNKVRKYPKPDEDRQVDVVTSTEYVTIDSIEYLLPEGFHPEHLPQDVEIKSRFGEYSASYQLSEKGLLYIRRLKRYKGQYPKETFNELADMLKKIKKADNQKVVLVGAT